VPHTRIDFYNLSPQQLKEILSGWNEPDFRVNQVIAAAWTPGMTSFAQATSLPLDLRDKLDRHFLPSDPPKPQTVWQAQDGTVKALFNFSDGARIESVSIPFQERLTFCLSTQCGCSLGCRFCATSTLGFKRNLTAGEIIAQIRGLAALQQHTPTNLVFMGMGEPLQNLDALRRVLEIIGHSKTLRWSPSKTTVSTSGWVPGIEAITREPIPAKLAFSLNAAHDDLRSKLMPVNRRYPLQQVLDALRKYVLVSDQPVTVEYVLLGGVNDRPEEARLLLRLLKNLPSKINLIPWNAAPGMPFRPPSDKAIADFVQELRRGHARVTLRASRGTEIGAACGQLAARSVRRTE